LSKQITFIRSETNVGRLQKTPEGKPPKRRAGGCHVGSARSVPPPTTMGPSVWAWIKPLTLEGARARLDVTCGHDRPCPGVRIANSDGCMGTVMPTPRTAADKHVGSPRCPSGQDGTS